LFSYGKRLQITVKENRTLRPQLKSSHNEKALSNARRFTYLLRRPIDHCSFWWNWERD